MKFRQGDVMLERVEDMPSGSIKQKKDKRIVLAYGEVTGHAHSIEDETTEEYKFDVDVFLKVLNATKLKHEEHGAIVLEPGIYRVIRQREYTPQEIRNVAD